tara:strand:- start:122 stop:247 length:126 start_codon:yes stop_codon:yes gene_type:complete
MVAKVLFAAVALLMLNDRNYSKGHIMLAKIPTDLTIYFKKQ